MWATPTTTVAVLRGAAADDYTGAVDNETTAASGIQASLIEQTRTVQDPASGTPRIVRSARARLPRDTDVVHTDRIRDERTGTTYAISDVRLLAAPFHLNDLTLELVRLDQLDP